MEETTRETETVNGGIYEYTFGGKTFVLKPLVLGQIKQLSNLLKGHFPDEISGMVAKTSVADILEKIQDVLPDALAIVLIEKGSDADTSPMKLKDRDLNALAEELAYTCDLGTIMRVGSDFFESTPITSALQMIFGLLRSHGMLSVPQQESAGETTKTESKTDSTGSTESSSTSQEVTSSEET